MFKSFLIATSSVFIFSACVSNNTYNLHQHLINFKSNETLTPGSCTSYSSKSSYSSPIYGKLFQESISLNSSCKWNGFQRGYFVNLFQNELNIKTMKNVETLDYPNYEITTYYINNDSYVNFIYYFLGNEDQFIIDYNGILSQEIAKKFDKTYKSNYIDQKRFISNFNATLVEKNIINNYFEEELEIME